MKCKIDGCDGKGVACRNTRTYPLGYCEKHYRQFRRTGNPIAQKRKRGENRKSDRLYSMYSAILSRCNNEKNPKYKNYGGRGISVANSWSGVDGFNNFKKDMGERPAGFSVDRIDNDGDYTPENCRWANATTQSRNRRMESYIGKSGHLGVFFNNNCSCYMASLKIKGKQHRRMAKSLEDAIQKRKELEAKYLTS